MFKKLICRFTNGYVTFEKVFRGLTEAHRLRKAAAYQAFHNCACLSMRHA